MIPSIILQHEQKDSLNIPKRKNSVCIDNYLIEALLNGYFEDKDILKFINQFKPIKYSSVRYTMRKLLLHFKVSTRSELYRTFLQLDFASVEINSNKIQQQLFLN